MTRRTHPRSLRALFQAAQNGPFPSPQDPGSCRVLQRGFPHNADIRKRHRLHTVIRSEDGRRLLSRGQAGGSSRQMPHPAPARGRNPAPVPGPPAHPPTAPVCPTGRREGPDVPPGPSGRSRPVRTGEDTASPESGERIPEPDGGRVPSHPSRRRQRREDPSRISGKEVHDRSSGPPRRDTRFPGHGAGQVSPFEESFSLRGVSRRTFQVLQFSSHSDPTSKDAEADSRSGCGRVKKIGRSGGTLSPPAKVRFMDSKRAHRNRSRCVFFQTLSVSSCFRQPCISCTPSRPGRMLFGRFVVFKYMLCGTSLPTTRPYILRYTLFSQMKAVFSIFFEKKRKTARPKKFFSCLYFCKLLIWYGRRSRCGVLRFSNMRRILSRRELREEVLQWWIEIMI